MWKIVVSTVNDYNLKTVRNNEMGSYIDYYRQDMGYITIDLFPSGHPHPQGIENDQLSKKKNNGLDPELKP